MTAIGQALATNEIAIGDQQAMAAERHGIVQPKTCYLSTIKVTVITDGDR